MNDMNFETAPSQVSRGAAVRPLGRSLDHGPHLVRLEDARPGDLVAMFGGYRANFEEGFQPQAELEGFYIQGDDGLEVRWYSQLPAPAMDHAARLVTEQLFLARPLHDDLLEHDVVEPLFYHVQSLHFVDAVLIVNRAWLEGDLYDEDLKKIHPVLFMMQASRNFHGAHGQAVQANLYLNVFRRMLPDHLRDLPDWDSVRPAPEAFLA